MRLIAEGTDDEETDVELRLDAVSAYLDLLDKPYLPDILVKIICWVSLIPSPPPHTHTHYFFSLSLRCWVNMATSWKRSE